MFKTAVFAFAISAAPSAVKAWGPIGHRVVGKIAENHLTPEAKAGVEGVLGVETLARASTWADEVRSHPDRDYYGKFDPWHYATVPSGEKYRDELAPKKKGDIVSAMKKTEAVLRDAKSEKKDRIEALRLLVHFVGDIHQPLHVGNGKDFGGNTCHVKWFGAPKKLHQIWDESLIDHLQLSYTEYAEFLDHPSDKDIARLQGSSYAEWADESSALLPGVYPGGAKSEDHPYCMKGWSERPDDKVMPDLKWNYAFEHRETLDDRLLAAGVRLAGVLNSIFK
ncbi:MAG: S1/P1 Nuclease [Elusimicrobia bacterium CG_4_9_14_3_um_filter_62_55]|nr:MAG: S1/P1 Nuclease [Elusimicrobia bacterium CG22_combo_CG10-13_8_21_14_all_63_91]PJA14166.1 MAG: S1/P1 Nuclease [Elusimicrobia bacterium CG_4_10_14_0_2_um_filter_63_34]PJB26789.1 MAG: S1/P1 Nuclease [Elusimicrobia bacterium CG_4_9_14_3_um_filter_62_55]